MNALKDNITIHLGLIQIVVSEVVIVYISCDTLNNLSNKVCVSNKTEDLNRVRHGYRNKRIENNNKSYIIMRM